VRKGIGEGRDDGTGVRLPIDGEDPRLILSILDRLTPPSIGSSCIGLRGLFNEEAPEGGEWSLLDSTDGRRCDTEGRGECEPFQAGALS